MANPDEVAASWPDRRPVVLRGGTVLTMDDAHTVLARRGRAGDRGQDRRGRAAPGGAGGRARDRRERRHRDAGDDRHPPAHVADGDARLRRGLDADPVLRLELPGAWPEFRPEDIGAGNLISAWEALEAGVTTTVDWSHNLHTPDHAEAAVEALRAVPGRFVFAYGNIQAGPWEWTADPAFRSFFGRHAADDMLGFQVAFDVTGDPSFPEKAAFEVARELGLPVTTHAGVWGATNDDGIRLMHENGFMGPETVYVHAATLSTDSYQRIAATGHHLGVDRVGAERRAGLPAHLAGPHRHWSRCRWTPACGGAATCFRQMRTTLGADRAREHLEAHMKGETVTDHKLRAEHVVDWATRGGARALGRDDLGQPAGAR